ncbi:carbamoyltransferase HypF [soil metagenome]
MSSPGVGRTRLRITGTVQGVGFRPFVFRLAEELGLTGFVGNDERGVFCEAEGPESALAEFARRIESESPPLAVIESVMSEGIAPTGDAGFEIVASERGGEPDAAVSPDSATCEECLAEVLDQGNRRFRYPFTNCTNCGPRFTIVRGVPYDRPQTTMAAFEMCERCRAEYEDPRDRRFHAQPNACPDCGPRVWLADRDGQKMPTGGHRDAVAAAAAELAAGRIVAIKGLGGFHLACPASDNDAFAALRARKHREDKPFALMAPSLAVARELVELTEAEELLLQGRERPIVIARRLEDAPVVVAVAPNGPELGVMLPYTPLHHLLLGDCGVSLVMTSANVSDEPIAYGDSDALARLGPIADLFLLHDREIHMRTDDSVVRALNPGLRDEPLLLRRSRGYAPASLRLPEPLAVPVLATGAELKSTFCVAKGDHVWPSHHIGDLKNFETLSSFADGIEHLERLFAVEPQLIAHDMHPDYLSSRYALERGDAQGIETLAVQHHHAHLASCVAEHRVEGPVVGAIFDGTGWGPDGTVWGGEILVGDASSYERTGLIFPVRLAGGDAAVKEPWRMACAWLAAASGDSEPPMPAALAGSVLEAQWRPVCELIRTGLNSPLTTSAGRLFDGVAALCGVRPRINYEGQAAAELEACADVAESGVYDFDAIDAGAAASGSSGVSIIDPRRAISTLLGDLEAGTPVGIIAARFHNGLAQAAACACAEEAERRNLRQVVLSGGVFQNRLLLERTATALRDQNLEVLIPRLLPPNDAGVSYGQIAVAAAR